MTRARRRGRQPARRLSRARPPTRARLFIGSHLDTVPHAGAFDGVLGVVLGVALVESLDGRRLPFSIEVVGFSEEEGVRFGVPFIGSRALVGTLDDALLDAAGCGRHSRSREAIRDFGLDPARSATPRADADMRSAISSSTSSRGRCSTPRPAARRGRRHRRPDPLRRHLRRRRESCRHDADGRAARRAGRRRGMDCAASSGMARRTPAWSPRSAGSRSTPGAVNVIAGTVPREPRRAARRRCACGRAPSSG